MTDRQVGGEGLNIDVVPTAPHERQTGALGLNLDIAVPPGTVVAHLLSNVDLVPSGIARRLGNVGLMVEYVASLVPTTAARWSGSVFQMGTASPLVYWSSGTFQSSGSTPVNWQTDHFAP